MIRRVNLKQRDWWEMEAPMVLLTPGMQELIYESTHYGQTRVIETLTHSLVCIRDKKLGESLICVEEHPPRGKKVTSRRQKSGGRSKRGRLFEQEGKGEVGKGINSIRSPI